MVFENCIILYILCFVFDFLLIDVYYCFINVCINKLNMILWKWNEYCIYYIVIILKCKNIIYWLVIGIRYGEKDVVFLIEI